MLSFRRKTGRGCERVSVDPISACPAAVSGGVALACVLLLVAACGDGPLAPASCGQLPQVMVNVGETSNVVACFNDANGDALNFAAKSSNPSVATASLSGTSITINGVAPGNATVTVTATDPGGLQAQSSFGVMVPNRAPQPSGTAPDVTVRVGSTAAVDVSQYFQEPDGQTLTYAAGSSDAAVASASVAGSVVTVTAEAKGRAIITATARDPGGLAANQSFRVTAPNRPPAPLGAIGAQTIEVGHSATIDVAGLFSDPDGDALTYTATSVIASVAAASVAGSEVTISARGPGTTTVAITATDDERATATQRVDVTVPQPNRAPQPVGSMPPQEILPGGTATVDVTSHFTDPDGDALTYSATSSDPSVALASVSGSAVTITGESAGSATITVTASDPEGLEATQQANVMVHEPNRAPQPVGSIPPQEVRRGETATVDVSARFSDPDGDPLTYSALSSEVGIASVQVYGATLEVSGTAEGRATITVTAADPDGLEATQSFEVTVISDGEPPGSFEIELRFATPMSATQRAAFDSARARWMAILADTELPDMPVPEGVVEVQIDGRTYEERVSVIDDLMIIAAVAEIDGSGGTLGQAAPRMAHRELWLPFLGVMEFDAADLDRMEANGILEAVILHEMGHVLGIGTLWGYHQLLRNPSLEVEREVDTHFAGALAIRAFDEVGGASYTAGAKVPVENMGTRPGSDDSHWRKRVFGHELMNPSAEPSMPLSAVTIASLADLGYAVRMEPADAYRLPGAAALLEHERRGIPLINDILRIPIEVRDSSGRVVGIIPP